MSNAIALIEKKHEARVDSLVLAESLGIQHKNVLALVDDNKSEFGEFGQLAFQTRVVSKKGAGQKTRAALLNEDQAYFLLTLTRNTKRTKHLKIELVKAFSRFRKHQQVTNDYLPFYHDFHDSVKVLSDMAHQNGSDTDEKLFHINFNKLINKAFGLDAGQRPDLASCLRAKVTQERQHFSRKLKWGPSDFSSEKFAGGYCLRRPAFVLLRPRRTTPLRYAARH